MKRLLDEIGQSMNVIPIAITVALIVLILGIVLSRT